MSIKVTVAEEAESFAIHEGIAGTLQRCIDGARTGKGELIRRAFVDEATISGTLDAKPVQWSLRLQPGPLELEANTRIERGPEYEASNSSSIHGR